MRATHLAVLALAALLEACQSARLAEVEVDFDAGTTQATRDIARRPGETLRF